MLGVWRLQLLREVSRRGSIKAAAEAMDITPSAVSQQLAILEREAGVQLLEKSGRRVRLTDAAQRLVRHADTITGAIASAEADLANWPKVRTYGEMATFINPSDPEILSGLGHAYLELRQPDKALFTYDTMLLTTPPPRRPALVHLGRARALLALGKKAEAQAALAQAMTTEPENAEALELKAKLK